MDGNKGANTDGMLTRPIEICKKKIFFLGCSHCLKDTLGKLKYLISNFF